MKDHLSRDQRNAIRYRIRATEQGVAAKYGITVATVRAVRANAQPDHPARQAAINRRWERTMALTVGGGGSGAMLRRIVVPAAELPPVKGQTALHVEGGGDLPQPLG